MTSANGVKQSYVRQRGTLVGATFTPATTGTASFIGVITGASTTSTGATALSAYAGYTISTVYLIPNKSMLSTTYRDNYARIARTESSVWDGAAWQLVTWVNFTYNWNNQLISRVSSNGDDYEAGYAGDLKIWDQDVTGITIYYDYDVGGRLWHVTKAGLNGAPNLVTTYAYNAASQVVSQSTNAVGGSEQLVSSHTYDLAGRMSSETPTGLGATTYAYDPVNRTTTATLPNGATQIQSLYLDGQPASKTGTGVVPEYYTYSIQSDGQKVTQVNLATSTSTRLVKTWTDWIDRTTRTERPGFAVTSQPVFYEQNTYSATTGLLTRTDRTVGSASLYQYDPLGNLILSGLDVTNNGTLDLTSTDRITGQDKWFANENGAWWLATTSTTYASATSSTPTTLQSTRQRLTGFTGNLRSESRMIDAEGNTTVQTVSVNSTTATVTQTTTLPGLANPKVDTAVNGLPVSSLSPDGLTSTISYDGLQRPQTTVDPRTGSSTVAYVSCTALPFTVTDSRNVVVATYNYDNLGRKNWVKNASGYYTRYAYDALGHVLNQWGDATSPCSYGYNAYGERVTLGTYQAENGWNAATWPGGTPTSTTTWNYDVPSGLLISKTDAANKSVTYTYNSRGQVAQRLWVRLTTGGQPITATYTYDTNTGDPLQTAYNDGTPTVSLTYNRLGQTTAATDWAGTRSFVYDSTSPWRLNTETLPTFYQSQIITRLYEATTNSAGTIKGATDGFQLGTAASPAASLQQTYAHNNGGRLANLTSAYGAGAVSQTFNYTYVTNSRLVQSLAAQGTAFTQTRSYEAQRDLLTSIVGQWSTATTSSYGYTYNDLGQRQTSTQGGTAFTADYGDVVTQNYTYDARGELSSAVASLGTNPTNQLPGRYFEYAYDAAGNRTLANHTGNSSLAEHFTSNALNQIASRENNSRAIQGVAATDAYAQVNSVASARQGSFWESELLLGNTGGTAVSTANVSIGASVSTGAPASAQTLYLLTGGASETLTHDLDGNLSADGIWTYSWDAENRLSTMMMNAGAVLPNGPPQQLLQFQYDYQGRRVSKKVSFWQGGTWVLQSERRFIYDGWNLIAETQANGTLIRSYTWGLDLTGSFTAAGGVGGLLQVTDHASGVRYFPTYDGNGNVTTLVNAATGSVAAIYEYNSFGELLRSQGSYASSNPIRFSSKFADDETGLIYYGHRYYDPHNGRFINRDPIEEAGGMNLYGFCGNDGVNHWDYLGNSWLSKIWHKITKWVGAHEWAAIAIGAVVGVLTAGAALYGLAPYVGVSMTYGQAITLALTGSNAVATLTGLGTAMVGGIAGFAGGVASSALSGANLRQSLKAGLVGGAMGAASAYAAYEIKAGINDIMQSKASFIEVTRDPLTKQYVASDFFDRGALSGSSNDYWMNGMLNDRGHAIELSLTQMNQNHYYIIYNESHGLLADMMESVAQKITGTSSISRDVADFMQTVNLSGSTFTVHSQAGLILNNAIEILHDRGVSMSGMHVAYNGAAVNEVASRGLLRTVGGVADYFQAHAGDAVPNLIGGNALYPFRPFDLALSIAEIPLLFVGGKSLSPHTVYVAPTP
ncbi:MAG: RHS repeat-associated core domain-containing protein [Verrucomicrobia bacterium]|nr:RHS repeat-associated core domain-containing protein [Verrucomicrobiota bacterium]